MFTAALSTTAKLWKQSRRSITDEWIKKVWYLYTMELYSATKKTKISYLQINGWNWRTFILKLKLARFRRPKFTFFSHRWNKDLIQKQ
jgi:hypothetical protein